MEERQSSPPTLYSLVIRNRLAKNGDLVASDVGDGCDDERSPAAVNDVKNSQAQVLSSSGDVHGTGGASTAPCSAHDEAEGAGENLAGDVLEGSGTTETLRTELNGRSGPLKKNPSCDHPADARDCRGRHAGDVTVSPGVDLSRKDDLNNDHPNRTVHCSNGVEEDRPAVEVSVRDAGVCEDSSLENRGGTCETSLTEAENSGVRNGNVHNADAVRQSFSHEHSVKSAPKTISWKLVPGSLTFPSLLRSSKQKSPEARHENGSVVPPLNGETADVSQDARQGSHEGNVTKKTRPKLTLKMPSLPKRLPGRRGTSALAPTIGRPEQSDISVPKEKITRQLTFPFSTMAHSRRGDKTSASAPAALAGSAQEARESTARNLSSGDEGCGPCGIRFFCAERVKRLLSKDGDSIEGKEIRNTVVVGLAFQLFYTAHFAIQNLQSSLHEEEYLGVSALSCLYATSIFSSIFAPTIIGLLGTKRSLVVAWFCHILYTLAQFYPSWETLVPASILLGTMTGPTWTAQGLYVTACAYSFSKRSPHSPYTILSRFNGLFFTLYETRQILGNLLSSVVLKDGVANKSSEVIFKFCGPKDCPAAENVTDIEEPDAWVIDVMLGIYMALQILGLFLTVFLVTPLARSEWSARAPVRETLTSWFKTLIGTEMLFLVPFMVFQAMEQGILLSEYTKSYISCPIGIHMVGFVMATHGATSAAFVFIFSRLARHTGRFPLFVFAAVISLVLLVVLFDWSPTSQQEALIFSFPVIWGIGEGIWQTQTNSMIAVIFTNRKEAAFANYQTWRAVGYTFVFSFHSVLCVSTKIAIALGLLLVGMILYTAVEVRLRRKDQVRGPKSRDVTTIVEKKPSTSAAAAAAAASTAAAAATTVVVGAAPDDPPRLPAALVAGGTGGEEGLVRSESDSVSGGGSNREEHCAEDCGFRQNGFSTAAAFAFNFDDVGTGGHLTLDGAYLSKDESPQLDNDVRVRYGKPPALPADVSGRESTAIVSRNSADGVHQTQNSWGVGMGEDESGWNSGSLEAANQRPSSRQHSKHDSHFQDEGELKVVWTKDDVFVY